jgi:DNA (cytosine-5)-methyltransferase 1
VFQQNQDGDVHVGEVAGSISTNPNASGRNNQKLQSGMQVRRLTPRECEALQGFPRDYTLIPIGKKMAADGSRYKALGNSMAVPVMNWIGRRIMTSKG